MKQEVLQPSEIDEIQTFSLTIGVRFNGLVKRSPSFGLLAPPIHSLRAVGGFLRAGPVDTSFWEQRVEIMQKEAAQMLNPLHQGRSELFVRCLKEAFEFRLGQLQAEDSPELLMRLTRKAADRALGKVVKEKADALDELTTANERKQILKDAKKRAARGMKCLTSRPVTQIQQVIAEFGLQIGVKVEQFTTDEDLGLIFKTSVIAKKEAQRKKVISVEEDPNQPTLFALAAPDSDPEEQTEGPVVRKTVLQGQNPVSSMTEAEFEAAKAYAMGRFLEACDKTFESGRNEEAAVYCGQVLRWRLEHLLETDSIETMVGIVEHTLAQIDVFSAYQGGATYRRLGKQKRTKRTA